MSLPSEKFLRGKSTRYEECRNLHNKIMPVEYYTHSDIILENFTMCELYELC